MYAAEHGKIMMAKKEGGLRQHLAVLERKYEVNEARFDEVRNIFGGELVEIGGFNKQVRQLWVNYCHPILLTAILLTYPH